MNDDTGLAGAGDRGIRVALLTAKDALAIPGLVIERNQNVVGTYD